MKKILYLLLTLLVVLTFASCQKDNNEVDASEIVEIQENAVDILDNQLLSEQNLSVAIENCIKQMMQNPEVESAYLQDSDQIVIRYKSGVTGVILLVDEEDNLKNDNPKLNGAKPLNHFSKGELEEVLITNHNVIIWEAFDDEKYPVADSLQLLFSSCPNINLNVTKTKGTSCTMQSLCDLTQYGFVYIHTHGGVFKNPKGEDVCWILTNEKYNPTTINIDEMKQYKKILVSLAYIFKNYNQEFQPRQHPYNGKTFWAVSNMFFSKYLSGTFNSPSIVYVQACSSYKNNSLMNVFINEKNASLYLGFNNTVSKRFGKEVAFQFIDNMLNQKLSADSAYGKLDTNVDPYCSEHAWFIGWPKEDPSYFTEEDDNSLGQLICDDGRKYQLHSCHYSPGGSLTFLHSNADGEPSYVMAFFSLTMCNTELGNFHPLQPSSTNEWMNLNSNDPWGFWVKNSCSDVSSRLSIAGGGSIKMTNGEVLYNSNTGGFSFSFTDEEGHNWVGTYNGPVS